MRILSLSLALIFIVSLYNIKPKKITFAKGILPNIFKQFQEGISPPTNAKNLIYEFGINRY